jgi:hypothetical protein
MVNDSPAEFVILQEMDAGVRNVDDEVFQGTLATYCPWNEL